MWALGRRRPRSSKWRRRRCPHSPQLWRHCAPQFLRWALARTWRRRRPSPSLHARLTSRQYFHHPWRSKRHRKYRTRRERVSDGSCPKLGGARRQRRLPVPSRVFVSPHFRIQHPTAFYLRRHQSRSTGRRCLLALCGRSLLRGARGSWRGRVARMSPLGPGQHCHNARSVHRGSTRKSSDWVRRLDHVDVVPRRGLRRRRHRHSAVEGREEVALALLKRKLPPRPLLRVRQSTGLRLLPVSNLSCRAALLASHPLLRWVPGSCTRLNLLRLPTFSFHSRSQPSQSPPLPPRLRGFDGLSL